MITQAPFGQLADGRSVTQYTLSNSTGITAKILNYGGTVRVLEAPDRNGRLADIVLGFDDIAGYESEHPYFGATIGRIAGRISYGLLNVEGKRYRLKRNLFPHHLHGGATGFNRRLWSAEVSTDETALRLSYTSPDGEEGYPGSLAVKITYRLTEADDLVIEYEATSDASTAVNLTNHSYFNLSGDPTKSILSQELMVHSSQVLELDEHLIPSGAARDVQGTRFDFLQSRPMESNLPEGAGNLDSVSGYDNYWILGNKETADEVVPAAEVYDKPSGRLMRIATSAPGVQIYTGTHFTDSLEGKNGVSYGPNCGVCFETQAYPDSPNRPEFPDIFLTPGERYRMVTVFSMRVR